MEVYFFYESITVHSVGKPFPYDVSSSYIFVNTHSSHLVQGITTLSVTAQDIFPSSEHSGTHTCLAGKMNDAMLIRTTCPVLYLVVSNIALWRL